MSSSVISMNLNLDFIPKQVLLKKVLRFQLMIICGLLLMSFISSLYRYSSFGQAQGFSLEVLYVDHERSIVTWYSVLLLLLCAILLAVIALINSRINARYIRHWQALALIFGFLSIDEAISIHEKLIFPLRAALNTSGFLYYAWVIVAIPLVAIFILFNLRFLAHLPRKTSRLFWLSGAIYVAGSIGFEMIGGLIEEAFSREALLYIISVHFEEGLELLGLTIFVYGLLSYIVPYIERVRVCLVPNPISNSLKYFQPYTTNSSS